MTQSGTLWNKLAQEIDEISADTIERVSGRLHAVRDGEEAAGVVTDLAKRLWALAEFYEYLEVEQHLLALTAPSELIEQIHSAGVKAAAVQEVLRSMAWAQMRDDADCWNCNIGLRAGFVLVKKKDEEAEHEPNVVIAAMPLSVDLLKLLGLKFGGENEDPPKPEPKPKVH